MKSQEMLGEALLEFDTTNAALIALLLYKKIFTIEELNECKVLMRPLVKEKGEKLKKIMQNQLDKENPYKELEDLLGKMIKK